MELRHQRHVSIKAPTTFPPPQATTRLDIPFFAFFPHCGAKSRAKAFLTPYLSLPFSLLTKHSVELHLRTNPLDYAAHTVEEVLKDHPLHFTFNRK